MALRSGAKGTSPEADITSTAIDKDHQALDVTVHGLKEAVDSRSTQQLLTSIDDKLGALLLLLQPAYASDEVPSLIRTAAQSLRNF